MYPCESYGNVLSLKKNQELLWPLEKFRFLQEQSQASSLRQKYQKEEKKEILVLEEEKREPNPNTHLHKPKKEKAHLQQGKNFALLEQEAHLQVKAKKIHSHAWRKGTQLYNELKEAHLQQKGKKGTHLKEKAETLGLQEKPKTQLYWQQEENKKEQKFMWVVKARHSICLPKPSAICRSIRPRISNPLPPVQGQIAATREEDIFRIWLRSRGENDACSSLMMGKSSHGRALFASRQILAGECILRISKHLVITPDKLHDEVKHLLHENISSCARLALLVLAEQYAGQASEWAPYMDCLPQLGALHNTVLWNDNDLEMIRQSSSAYRHSMQFRATISEEFAAVQHLSRGWFAYENVVQLKERFSD